MTKIEKTPLYKGLLMWRVWNKGDPDGPYWYVDAKDKEDAMKQIARALGSKMAEFDAKQGAQ